MSDERPPQIYPLPVDTREFLRGEVVPPPRSYGFYEHRYSSSVPFVPFDLQLPSPTVELSETEAQAQAQASSSAQQQQGSTSSNEAPAASSFSTQPEQQPSSSSQEAPAGTATQERSSHPVSTSEASASHPSNQAQHHAALWHFNLGDLSIYDHPNVEVEMGDRPVQGSDDGCPAASIASGDSSRDPFGEPPRRPWDDAPDPVPILPIPYWIWAALQHVGQEGDRMLENVETRIRPERPRDAYTNFDAAFPRRARARRASESNIRPARSSSSGSSSDETPATGPSPAEIRSIIGFSNQPRCTRNVTTSPEPDPAELESAQHELELLRAQIASRRTQMQSRRPQMEPGFAQMRTMPSQMRPRPTHLSPSESGPTPGPSTGETRGRVMTRSPNLSRLIGQRPGDMEPRPVSRSSSESSSDFSDDDPAHAQSMGHMQGPVISRLPDMSRLAGSRVVEMEPRTPQMEPRGQLRLPGPDFHPNSDTRNSRPTLDSYAIRSHRRSAGQPFSLPIRTAQESIATQLVNGMGPRMTGGIFSPIAQPGPHLPTTPLLTKGNSSHWSQGRFLSTPSPEHADMSPQNQSPQEHPSLGYGSIARGLRAPPPAYVRRTSLNDVQDDYFNDPEAYWSPLAPPALILTEEESARSRHDTGSRNNRASQAE